MIAIYLPAIMSMLLFSDSTITVNMYHFGRHADLTRNNEVCLYAAVSSISEATFKSATIVMDTGRNMQP